MNETGNEARSVTVGLPDWLEAMAASFENGNQLVWDNDEVAQRIRDWACNAPAFDQTTKALRASLREMVDIYWGAGDGQQPAPVCIQNAERALAQPTAAWQPIKTAPKDRFILAIRAEYWMPVNGDNRWVFSRIRETNWLTGSERFDFGDEKQPTHWMLRPDPPSLSKETP